MAPRTEYVVLQPEGPCPCRSGRITVECCMAADGSFRVAFPSPVPAGEPTGFAHPDCYMRGTDNCSADIATGRQISGALADFLGGEPVFVYLPWDHRGKEPEFDIDNLPAGILCGRHHAALAPLDDVALQAFRNILDAMNYVGMKSLATKQALYAASGEGFELWLLKFLFGAYHASLAAGGETAPKNVRLPEFDVFRKALETGALAAPCGLYAGREAMEESGRSEPIHKRDRIRSLRLDINSLDFELVVDPTGPDFDAMRRAAFYRPSGIDLFGKKRNAHIHLSGPAFATNESARFTLSEPRRA